MTTPIWRRGRLAMLSVLRPPLSSADRAIIAQGDPTCTCELLTKRQLCKVITGRDAQYGSQEWTQIDNLLRGLKADGWICEEDVPVGDREWNCGAPKRYGIKPGRYRAVLEVFEYRDVPELPLREGEDE